MAQLTTGMTKTGNGHCMESIIDTMAQRMTTVDGQYTENSGTQKMIIITRVDDRTIYHTDDKGFRKHRADGPASIWHNTGICYWYLNGQPHRYYGPQTDNNFERKWMIHGRPCK